MKYALLILAFICAGCWSDPGQEGGDPVSPVVAPVSATVFFEDMAVWVESGEVSTTNEFLKVTGGAAAKLKISLGPAYDEAFKDLVEANRDLTEADKKDIAARLRKLK